jgi:hypothetical protein
MAAERCKIPLHQKMKKPVKPAKNHTSDFPEISYIPDHVPTQPVPLKERPRQFRIDHEMAIIRAQHEQIARKIEVFWGEQECIKYIRHLIISGDDASGHDRECFKHEVLSALINLQALHKLRKTS